MSEKLREYAAGFITVIEMYQTVIRDGVEEGSPFKEDLVRIRQGSSPYELASELLSNALDALHTLAFLWSEAQVHSPTDYALMRVAIDNALRAIWLTSPTSSDDRLRRAWRVAIDAPARAKRDAEAALKRGSSGRDEAMYRATGVDTKAQIAALVDKFSSAGVDVGARVIPLEIREILGEESLSVWLDEMHVRRLWTLLSSMVHGSLTQVRAFAISRQDPDDERIRLHDPDPDMIASVAASVNAVVTLSWYTFATRMSADRGQEPFALRWRALGSKDEFT